MMDYNSMSERIENNISVQRCILFVASMAIVIYNIRFISKIEMPSIIVDEIGYLASGAFFRGWNWGDVMSSYSSYYAYGYGLFVSLVFLIFGENMFVAYKTLIVCNALAIAMSFVISVIVIKQFEKRFCVRAGICFVLAFLPSVIHHAQFAWSETPLFVTYWLITYFLSKYCEERKTVYLKVTSFLHVYLYFVHQRAIGILLFYVVFLLMLLWKKVISKKTFVVAISIVVLMMLIGTSVKQLVVNAIFSTNTAKIVNAVSSVNTNDYSGQINKIMAIFSKEGFTKLIVSIFGKITYFGLETLMLGFEGIVYCTIAMMRSLRSNNFIGKNYLTIYWLGSYFITLLIAAVFHIHPTRIDVILYGRYTDWLIAPLVAMGMMFMKEFWGKRMFIYLLLEMICLLCVISFMKYYKLYSNFATCSPITFWFRNIMCECKPYWVTFMFLVLTIMSTIVMFLMKHEGTTNLYFGLIITLLIWGFMANDAVKWDISMGEKTMLRE